MLQLSQHIEQGVISGLCKTGMSYQDFVSQLNRFLGARIGFVSKRCRLCGKLSLQIGLLTFFMIVRGTFVKIQFVTPVGNYIEFRQTDCLFDSICMNQINNCLLLAGSLIEHSLRDSLGCSWQSNFLLQRKCFETFGYNAIKIGLFHM